jgi:hypothetical protein
MSASSPFFLAARDYAAGVHALLAPSGVSSAERGGPGPASFDDLAQQAERLSPLSIGLTEVTSARLTDADLVVRTQASTSLLAKALTDLEISAYLFEAARDEEEGGDRVVAGPVRSAAGLGSIDSRLRLILGEVPPGPATVERAQRAPGDVPTARAELIVTVKDVTALIFERAGKGGQSALGGLLGLSVSEVMQAAGLIGMDIAQALGQAEKLSRLYDLFREFVLNALRSLVALLGETVAQAATGQVLVWVDELRSGTLFSDLLEQLYETRKTRDELARIVEGSQASVDALVAAIRSVDGLCDAYRRQVDLADSVLRVLRFLGGVPASALPHGRLLLAASYILVGGYVILAGADYVDARRLSLLSRVPGVRDLINVHLATGSSSR